MQVDLSHIAGRSTKWHSLLESSLALSCNIKHTTTIIVLVAQLCLTLCDPMNCILPGSSVHRILQARMTEMDSQPLLQGGSQLKGWTQVSCIAGGFFTV